MYPVHATLGPNKSTRPLPESGTWGITTAKVEHGVLQLPNVEHQWGITTAKGEHQWGITTAKRGTSVGYYNCQSGSWGITTAKVEGTSVARGITTAKVEHQWGITTAKAEHQWGITTAKRGTSLGYYNCKVEFGVKQMLQWNMGYYNCQSGTWGITTAKVGH